MLRLSDSELPPFFQAADNVSDTAQKTHLRSNSVRLYGAIAAALGSGFSIYVGRVDLWAAVALVGFLFAFGAEMHIVVARPERRWYQARAAAESAKTLSWRYAVGADPFALTLDPGEAANLFRARIGQVALRVAQSVSIPSGDASAPTRAMVALREAPVAEQRQTYLEDRTRRQRDWYTNRAEKNRIAAVRWRVFLLVAEVVAIVLAAGRLFGGWPVDLAGVLAAVISGGAAWLALKQHVTLRAAYALTAGELETQIATLEAAPDANWSTAVADAEEAISREHTMWLASRGEVNETID